MAEDLTTLSLRRRGTIFAALAVVVAALALGSSSAAAATTHPFLGYITLPSGTEAQPEGVDDQGNLIVWLNGQQEIAKFDPSGNPVNFSGLGTNVIDGKGGFPNNCPATPSDCDRTPFDGVYADTTTDGSQGDIVAVDHSGGPTDGYIYMQESHMSNPASCGGGGGLCIGAIDVFNAAGVYQGRIPFTEVGPNTSSLYTQESTNSTGAGISVSSTGAIYDLPYPGYHPHVDSFFPLDGSPTHDVFAGQIQTPCSLGGCVGSDWYYHRGVGGANYYYAYIGYREEDHWIKLSLSAFRENPRLNDPPEPVDFSQGTANPYSNAAAPFERGGSVAGGGTMKILAIDPVTQDVYIAGNSAGDGGIIQQWTDDNQKVGPDFGAGHIGLAARSIAIDRSGDADDGNIYIQGPSNSGNKIAVFGKPVVVPDISGVEATGVHTTATVDAHISLGVGSPISECKVEYGPEATYGQTQTCAPATPYATGEDVTASIPGLAPEQEYHYRVSATDANGTDQSVDHVLYTHAVLDVNTDPITGLTQNSATLHGSLNPDGMATKYQYEWGVSTDYKELTPLTVAPSGNTPMAVQPFEASNLQPGRTYHYRLIAKNTYGFSAGEDRSFTVPSKPAASGLTAANVALASADLKAKINPFASDTTYHFEYGVTAQYGQRLPDGNLSGEGGVQDVSGHIEGLQPGLTYHFRILATNQWGTVVSPDATFSFLPPNCPNSHVRQLTGANYLPDCRAYELVSPEEAGSVTLFPGTVSVAGAGRAYGESPDEQSPAQNALGLAQSPSRFGFYGGIGSIKGLDPPNVLIDRYVATRTGSGWVTTYPGRLGDQTTHVTEPTCDASLGKCIDYYPGVRLSDEHVIPGSEAPYVWDISGKSLGRWPTNLGAVTGGEGFIGDRRPSADFSHFAFSSRDVSFAAGGLHEAPGSVYDNDIVAATVTVASKLADGSNIPEPPGNADPAEFFRIPAISMDGSHILMSMHSHNRCGEVTCPNPPCGLDTNGPGGTPIPCPTQPINLFMRVDDSVTYDISRGFDVTYVGMTRSGDKVFFTSKQQILPEDTDSSSDLYMWSEKTDSLTLISQGNGNGNGDDCNASWTPKCGAQPITPRRPVLDNTYASGNGDVYFYSPEQLDATNPGVHNERNLYVYREGHVQYVTSLDPGTQVDRMQISPDDSHMAFLTRSRVTAYDNQGWEEMYTYDPSDGTILCASCIPSGEPPSNSYLFPPTLEATERIKDVQASASGRFMSDDGRVAFSTDDALVPGDTNNAIDVYEFSGGSPQLISSGTQSTDAQTSSEVSLYPGLYTGFESISANGIDLYFSTFDTLVPQDRNGHFVKFYDARANGGFPATPPPLPCTAADECHGDSSVSPGDLQVGTGAALTGGNLSEAAHHKGKLKKARQKRRHKKHRRQRRHAREVRHG